MAESLLQLLELRRLIIRGLLALLDNHILRPVVRNRFCGQESELPLVIVDGGGFLRFEVALFDGGYVERHALITYGETRGYFKRNQNVLTYSILGT